MNKANYIAGRNESIKVEMSIIKTGEESSSLINKYSSEKITI